MANNCQLYHDLVAEREKALAFAQSTCEALANLDPPLSPLEFRHRCIQPRAEAEDDLEKAKEALRNCEAGLPAAGRQKATGRVVFLRVHETGIRFGKAPDVLT